MNPKNESLMFLTASEAEHIGPLDPLGADESLSHLPAWNAAIDVNAITAALNAICPTKERAKEMGPYEAAASLRDMGMFLSSLKRHGVEPAVAAPSVVAPLLVLGRTCGMVPRDTVYHYGPWNPTGLRERRFTDDLNEESLIHCVRSAAPGVEAAIVALSNAREEAPGTPAFTAACLSAAQNTRSMIESINFARANVSVDCFARVLRPYFEGITLGGHVYMGAAAAHLPLCVVDHLSWGSDCDDSTYRIFQEDVVTHTVPRWRQLYRDSTGTASLVTRLIEAFERGPMPNPAMFESATALHAVFRVLLTFRGRHKVIADKAYDPKLRTYPVGSGGFSTEVVDRILEVTRARTKALEVVVKKRHGKSLHPVRYA